MSVCDLPVIATVCDTAGEAAATAVIAPFQFLADGMVTAAAWLIRVMWAAFETTTFVDLTSPRFTAIYNIIFGLAIFLMIGFFLFQVIAGMIRRDPAALSRALLGMGKGVLGSFVVVTLLAAALEITDRLCLGVMAAAGTNVDEMGERVSLLTAGLTVSAAGGPAMPILVVIALAGLAIAASFLVWISLLVRKALLLIAVVFAPVAFAGATWDAARGWATRWGTFVLALVASKLVVVVVFLLATAQVSAPISADLQSFADPMAGVVLMLVAGFAPYLTYKAISFMGIDAHQATAAEQDAKHALDRPMPLPHHAPPRRQATPVLDSPTPQPARTTSAPGPTPGSTRGAAQPTVATTPASSAPAAAAGAGGSGAGAGTGAAAGAGAGAAAGGLAAAGAVVAGEAAKSGPRAGRFVAGQAGQQDDDARGAGS